jgi:hypothetical protein
MKRDSSIALITEVVRNSETSVYYNEINGVASQKAFIFRSFQKTRNGVAA